MASEEQELTWMYFNITFVRLGNKMEEPDKLFQSITCPASLGSAQQTGRGARGASKGIQTMEVKLCTTSGDLRY